MKTVELCPPVGMGPNKYVSVRELPSRVLLKKVEGHNASNAAYNARKWVDQKGYKLV